MANILTNHYKKANAMPVRKGMLYHTRQVRGSGAVFYLTIKLRLKLQAIHDISNVPTYLYQDMRRL